MTKQEINEFIAGHYFAYKLAKNCSNRVCEVGNGICENCLIDNEVPDYITNYQPVLEKLMTLKNEYDRLLPNIEMVSIIKQITGNFVCKIQYEDYKNNHGMNTGLYDRRTERKNVVYTSKSIGEAICRCAVEFDKTARGME